MGMFDDIKCEYPLPDAEAQGETFQTKDLDCLLDTFTITKEGRLMYHAYDTLIVPEDERTLCKGIPPEKRTELQKTCGMFGRKNERLEDENYHGYLRFYTSINGVQYEYMAKFTDGDVESIDRVIKANKGN